MRSSCVDSQGHLLRHSESTSTGRAYGVLAYKKATATSVHMHTQERAVVVIISAQVLTAQRDELARLAQEADRSLSAEIRRALTAHVERAHTEETEEA